MGDFHEFEVWPRFDIWNCFAVLIFCIKMQRQLSWGSGITQNIEFWLKLTSKANAYFLCQMTLQDSPSVNVANKIRFYCRKVFIWHSVYQMAVQATYPPCIVTQAQWAKCRENQIYATSPRNEISCFGLHIKRKWDICFFCYWLGTRYKSQRIIMIPCVR